MQKIRKILRAVFEKTALPTNQPTLIWRLFREYLQMNNFFQKSGSLIFLMANLLFVKIYIVARIKIWVKNWPTPSLHPSEKWQKHSVWAGRRTLSRPTYRQWIRKKVTETFCHYLFHQRDIFTELNLFLRSLNLIFALSRP